MLSEKKHTNRTVHFDACFVKGGLSFRNEDSGFINFQVCLNCFDLCCSHQELEQNYKGKNCSNAAILL